MLYNEKDTILEWVSQISTIITEVSIGDTTESQKPKSHIGESDPPR